MNQARSGELGAELGHQRAQREQGVTERTATFWAAQ